LVASYIHFQEFSFDNIPDSFSSNSHFGIQPKNSPPLAGCFWASKLILRTADSFSEALDFECATRTQNQGLQKNF